MFAHVTGDSFNLKKHSKNLKAFVTFLRPHHCTAVPVQLLYLSRKIQALSIRHCTFFDLLFCLTARITPSVSYLAFLLILPVAN